MSRVIRIAAAQMGATQKADPRERTLGRMLSLLEGAAKRGATLLVFRNSLSPPSFRVG